MKPSSRAHRGRRRKRWVWVLLSRGSCAALSRRRSGGRRRCVHLVRVCGRLEKLGRRGASEDLDPICSVDELDGLHAALRFCFLRQKGPLCALAALDHQPADEAYDCEGAGNCKHGYRDDPAIVVVAGRVERRVVCARPSLMSCDGMRHDWGVHGRQN